MTETHSALLPRGVIAVGGADRHKFLQGMVSNDIAGAAPNRAVYGAMLNPQGKFLHDLFIIDIGGALWLDCATSGITSLIRHLNHYKLRSAVTITDLSESQGVAVTFFGQQGATTSYPETNGGFVFPDPRLPALGQRRIAPSALLPTEDVAAVCAYHRLRLSLGVPDGALDMIPSDSILLEYSLEKLNGISFEKGCYIGQELTARTFYRALIKKRAYPVHINGPCPAPGTAVTLENEAVGTMRSSQDDVGLAVLKISAVESTKEFQCDTARLRVEIPDWMRK